MHVERPLSRTGNHNGSHQGRPLSSISGALPKPLGNAFQAASKRLQLKDVLAQLTLDWYTAAMAIKASIPPTIFLCAIQSNTWINMFKTQAYMAAIISICVPATLPRARLIEYNFQLALAVALSYCWVLLGGWSGLQARKHTISSSEGMNDYNSSAAAVSAIFMMFWIWCSFTLKSAFPNWGLQCTWAGIFAVSAFPLVAKSSDMQDIFYQATNILEVLLAGQAVGFVNALIIFPQSCRGVFRKDMRACLDGLVSVMQAQQRCIEDFRSKRICDGEDERNTTVYELQKTLQNFINSIMKTRGDVEYAEREMAWDRLDHPQLEHISSMLADLIPPVSGLGSVADMLQLAADGYCHSPNANAETEGKWQSKQYWHSLEEKMHEQSYRISEAIIEGVEHVKLRLELRNRYSLFNKFHARKMDEESQVFSMKPGDPSFVKSYQDVFDTCCVFGQGSDGAHGEKLLDHYIQHRPQIGDLGEITPEADSDTLRYFLLLHVSGQT